MCLQISHRASPFAIAAPSPFGGHGSCPTCHICLQASQDLVVSIPRIMDPLWCQVHILALQLMPLPLVGWSHAVTPWVLGHAKGSTAAGNHTETRSTKDADFPTPCHAASYFCTPHGEQSKAWRGQLLGPQFPMPCEKLHFCSSNSPYA